MTARRWAEPTVSCPTCGRKPRFDDLWECPPPCGTVFRAFWSGGTCPGCGRRCAALECPACAEVSPLGRWSRYPDCEDVSRPAQ